jgi:hypothetical protein
MSGHALAARYIDQILKGGTPGAPAVGTNSRSSSNRSKLIAAAQVGRPQKPAGQSAAASVIAAAILQSPTG